MQSYVRPHDTRLSPDLRLRRFPHPVPCGERPGRAGRDSSRPSAPSVLSRWPPGRLKLEDLPPLPAGSHLVCAKSAQVVPRIRAVAELIIREMERSRREDACSHRRATPTRMKELAYGRNYHGSSCSQRPGRVERRPARGLLSLRRPRLARAQCGALGRPCKPAERWATMDGTRTTNAPPSERNPPPNHPRECVRQRGNASSRRNRDESALLCPVKCTQPSACPGRWAN